MTGGVSGKVKINVVLPEKYRGGGYFVVRCYEMFKNADRVCCLVCREVRSPILFFGVGGVARSAYHVNT